MSKITFPFNTNDLKAALGNVDHSEGRYILGANQFWHGGIHLTPSTDKKAILAPADGEILAHRTMTQRTKGATCFEMDEKGNKTSTQEEENSDISYGFVLTRHHYTTPKEQKITYYVLHLHLLCYERYQTAHKVDPPPYLYKHQFFIKKAEDDGGSLIGKGVRLRSAPKDSNEGITNNVLTVLKKDQEIRFIKRGEYKQGSPPSGKKAYLKVEVLTPKTVSVSGLVTTGVDDNNQLKLMPEGFNDETIESVRYDVSHQKKYLVFTVNTHQDNECGLAVYVNSERNQGKDLAITLPFGHRIELAEGITLSELQEHRLLPINPVTYTQPKEGYVYCGQGYIDKKNPKEVVGKFDQIEILNPPMPVHSGEVIGYPGDYQGKKHVHMELWLENIDFFDNPKGDKRLSDALTLPQGIPAKKSKAPTGKTITLTPEERIYEVSKLNNGIINVEYGNPPQRYFIYEDKLTDYIAKNVKDRSFGTYTAKNADAKITVYTSDPSESDAEETSITLATGEYLHLVRPELPNGVRKVLYGNPPNIYFTKRSDLGKFTYKSSYRPTSIDGSITLYPSNPEEYTYTDSTLPQFHIIESLPKTKTLNDKTYYRIEMPEKEESTVNTHYLIEESEFDKYRLNYYDWKAFFLKKENIELLGLKPSGYYADDQAIRDKVLDELNEHIVNNTMQQLPAYQSAHPLMNLMVKAGSEWSKSHKDSVNWAGDMVDHLWEQAKVTPEEEQGGITKDALKNCFNETIKPFSDEIAFYDTLKAGIPELPDKSAIWHAHPLKFLGHLDLINKSMLLTLEKLKKIFPDSKEAKLIEVLEVFNRYADSFGLNSVLKIAHFFAQVKQEVGSSLVGKEESLWYSIEGLKSKFTRYFDDYPEEAETLGYKRIRISKYNNLPKADKEKYVSITKVYAYSQIPNENEIAKRVYCCNIAGKNFNLIKGGCDEGILFKGKGFIQLTWRENYKNVSDIINNKGIGENVDFVKNPEILKETKAGLLSAMGFWEMEKINEKIIEGNNQHDTVDNITAVVNYYTKSYKKRKNNFDFILKVLENNI